MEIWGYMGSLLGLAAFIQAVMPPEFRYMLSRVGRFIFEYLSVYNYFDIYEFDGMNSNELYSCVQLHLSSSASVSAQRATLSRPKNSNKITFGLAKSERVTENYKGAQVWWQHIITEWPAQFSLWERSSDERRFYTLKIRKQDRERILNSYLDYILDHAKELQHGNRDKLLYTNANNSYNFHRQPWESVPFKHPSTFSTLALDPAKKEEVLNDLREEEKRRRKKKEEKKRREEERREEEERRRGRRRKKKEERRKKKEEEKKRKHSGAKNEPRKQSRNIVEPRK